MSIQEKLAASAAHLLAPDEEIQVAFPARSRNPTWSHVRRVPYIGAIAHLVMRIVDVFRNTRLAIVVTDTRILVARRGRYTSRVTDMIRQLPRRTQIGFADGTHWVRAESLGMKVYIEGIYAPDVMLANAKGGETGAIDVPE